MNEQVVDAQFLRHVAARYETVAGSTENLESIAAGLRSASAITLTGAGSVTFTPPTAPMGYGNVTRTLELAGRHLAAAGVRAPTAEQLQQALMAVLTLRASGLDWGRIAYALLCKGENRDAIEIRSPAGMGACSVS